MVCFDFEEASPGRRKADKIYEVSYANSEGRCRNMSAHMITVLLAASQEIFPSSRKAL